MSPNGHAQGETVQDGDFVAVDRSTDKHEMPHSLPVHFVDGEFWEYIFTFEKKLNIRFLDFFHFIVLCLLLYKLDYKPIGLEAGGTRIYDFLNILFWPSDLPIRIRFHTVVYMHYRSLKLQYPNVWCSQKLKIVLFLFKLPFQAHTTSQH